MAANQVQDIPADVQKTYRRFVQWRSSHTGRLPIPEPLWTAAAELAREHGINATAKVLHLEYGKLKGKTLALGQGAGVERSRRTAGPRPQAITASTTGVCRAVCSAEFRQFPRMPCGVGGTAREDADRVQGHRHSGTGGARPGVVGR